MYFQLLVLNKILALDVFDYGDSKSEIWHRAKKIREVLMVNKSPRALFPVIENRVCFGRRFKTIIKIYLKTVGAGNFFSKLCLKNLHFFYICIKLCRTQLKMAQQINFVKLSIMQIKILNN